MPRLSSLFFAYTHWLADTSKKLNPQALAYHACQKYGDMDALFHLSYDQDSSSILVRLARTLLTQVL